MEVAHDFQQETHRYIVEYLKLLNSYATWHGKYIEYFVYLYNSQCRYKNVAKTLIKVIKGRRGNPVKDLLGDKRLSVSHTHTSFFLPLMLQVVAPRDSYTDV